MKFKDNNKEDGTKSISKDLQLIKLMIHCIKKAG